jgi:glycerol-3-phosphate acyltransferase PlsY
MPDAELGLVSVVVGYLLGSIPGAYIIAKLNKGVDIRKVDTGNVGAASTLRAIGIWQGIVAGLIDIAKGSAAILIAQVLGIYPLWILGAGFAAYLGHNYPVYLGFKGGQGVATMIGIFLVLTPFAAMSSIAIIVLIMYLNRRVILRRIFFAVLVGGPFLPVFIWIFNASLVMVAYSVFLIAFMICKNWHSVRMPLKLIGCSRPGKPLQS